MVYVSGKHLSQIEKHTLRRSVDAVWCARRQRGEEEDCHLIQRVFAAPFAHAYLFINRLRIWNPTQLLSDIVKPYVSISIEDTIMHNMMLIQCQLYSLSQIASITSTYTYFYENYGDSMSTLERLLATPSTRKCIEV